MIAYERMYQTLASGWRSAGVAFSDQRHCDEMAEHCEAQAIRLALDGVDLDPDAILAPCALTPGALFGND